MATKIVIGIMYIDEVCSITIKPIRYLAIPTRTTRNVMRGQISIKLNGKAPTKVVVVSMDVEPTLHHDLVVWCHTHW